MQTLAETLQLLRTKRDYFQQKYHVSRMAVFGSVARGDQTATSDVDLLVEFDRPVGMLKYMALANELEATLDSKVDLTTFRSLKPYQWDFIREEVVYL